MSTKSFLFRIFFLLIRSSPKFNIKYSFEWQKKRVVNEPFIITTQKVIEFESWILTHFQAKNRSKFTFQTQ